MKFKLFHRTPDIAPQPHFVEKEPSKIQKVIHSYLKLETNYALLINGARGIGKTFFIKNTLLPQIKLVPRFHDQAKYYKPIYISLYGVKSIDEVYNLLLFEFIPILKKARVKLGAGLAKIIARAYLSYNRAGNIDDYFRDISKTTKETLDTKDFVIIFDDLDRIAAQLSANEFVGFVNALVEHDNNKVLIVADQNHIEDSAYNEVREKTIGTVIEFTNSFQQTYDEIILAKYRPSFRSYYDNLVLLKPEILSVFNQAEVNNLRTLIYFLQHLDQIFHALHFYLRLDKKEPDQLSIDKLIIVTRFTLAIAIEFKKGKVSYKDPNGIDQVTDIHQLLHHEWLKETFVKNMQRSNGVHENDLVKTGEQQKTYKELFVNMYFNNRHYDFYRSIFDFVTGGNELDVELLKKELKENIDDKIVTQTPQMEIFNKLSYPQVWDLDNQSLRELTAEMYTFALNGDYPLGKYLPVFHFLERFSAVLKYDPNEVAQKLIGAIDTNKEKFVHDPRLTHTFGTNPEQANLEQFKELAKALNRVNQSVKIIEAESRVADLFEEFKQNPGKFYIAAQSDYFESSIFNKWDFTSFSVQFQQMPVSSLIQITEFLKQRYGQFASIEWVEFDFILELSELVQNREQSGEATLRDYILDDLSAVLQDIIKRYEAYKKIHPI